MSDESKSNDSVHNLLADALTRLSGEGRGRSVVGGSKRVAMPASRSSEGFAFTHFVDAIDSEEPSEEA